jgi:hypothetical protein
MRRLVAWLAAVMSLAASTCWCEPSMPTGKLADGHTDTRSVTAQEIIVAIEEAPMVRPSAGATPRMEYRMAPGYAGSRRTAVQADTLAKAHGLTEVSSWSIASLGWRCMLYRLQSEDAAMVMAAVARDPRVRLVQPLQSFETYGRADYNDPYVGLQSGFQRIHAASAHRYTEGRGVTVAVIDTGVDAAHPDLAGTLAAQRDFVPTPAATGGEKHGTEVAGVIAARARNGLGIVGVAPKAEVLALRACWPPKDGTSPSRCNSFTLALALGAAIDAHADVINLSLGGPADPLLSLLVEQALRRGAIVVGAVPPDGRMTGFPIGVKGVWAVSESEADLPSATEALRAPGKDVLTLEPGGHYGFASGSSLAAAHVSGAAALLRSLLPNASPAQLRERLARRTPGRQGTVIDVCAALSGGAGAGEGSGTGAGTGSCDPAVDETAP